MNRRFLTAGALALLALLLLVGCGNDANTSSTNPTTSGSGATPIATAAQPTPPAAQATTLTIGKTYQIGGTWTITVNSIKKLSVDPANPYIKPDTGKQFIVLNVTMANASTSTQHVSDILMFDLRDANGQTAKIAFLQSAEQAPNGPVSAGEKLTGDLVYQVPTAQHTLSLGFVPSMGAERTEWTFSV